jgi:hypothetical protein
MEGSRKLHPGTFEERLLRAFIEVFNSPQVKQFIEEMLRRSSPPGSTANSAASSPESSLPVTALLRAPPTNATER